MGVAERLTIAVSDDDLGWSDIATKPIDLVAALSGASGLGSDIMRARGHDRQALHRAILLLTKKALNTGHRNKTPISRSMAISMASAVIAEIVVPNCRTCRGAKVFIEGQLKITCPTCGGIGVFHHTDNERARMIGVHREEFSKLRSRYQMVMDIALRYDCAPQQAAARLG